MAEVFLVAKIKIFISKSTYVISVNTMLIAQFFILPISLLGLPISYLLLVIFIGFWNLLYLICAAYLYLVRNIDKVWPMPFVLLFSPVLLILTIPVMLFLLGFLFEGDGELTVLFNLYKREKLDKYNKSTFKLDSFKKFFGLKNFLICFALYYIGLNILYILPVL